VNVALISKSVPTHARAFIACYQDPDTTSEMPRGKSPTFERQRIDILQAAAPLFAERGFASASMSELARACEISKPLLYHYYRGKDELLFDIANGYVERLIAIAAEVRLRRLPPEPYFRALIDQFMREYEHAQSQHMVLVQDVKFLSPSQRETVEAKERKVVDEFARVIAALKPRSDKSRMRVPLTMILFGMINWTFTWLRTDGSVTYGDMAGIVSDIFLHGAISPPASE
jgi:AcrR family transcriptional regulator